MHFNLSNYNLVILTIYDNLCLHSNWILVWVVDCLTLVRPILISFNVWYTKCSTPYPLSYGNLGNTLYLYPRDIWCWWTNHWTVDAQVRVLNDCCWWIWTYCESWGFCIKDKKRLIRNSLTNICNIVTNKSYVDWVYLVTFEPISKETKSFIDHICQNYNAARLLSSPGWT